MRGDYVIVRAFGGKPLKRRVWGVGDSVVFVTDDEQFERLVAGKKAIEPLGFPKDDVFENTANEYSNGSVDWSRLIPWES